MKVVLEGLAVQDLLLLLLQLIVRLGTGAAAPPRGGLISVVPLLLVLTVQVGRLAGRQLHPCSGGAKIEYVMALQGEAVRSSHSSMQTLKAVIELVEVTVFWLLAADDPVVGDVAIGAGRRLPLKNDLGGRVGGGDGVQRHRGF